MTYISVYTALSVDGQIYTNFSTKYLMMCKVFTDVGGKNSYTMGCPPGRKIIHSLKLVDYLHVQADNPWYKYYLINFNISVD